MKLTREFIEAIEQHLQLVDTLGVNHPDTMRTMVTVEHNSLLKGAVTHSKAAQKEKAPRH